LHHLDSLEATTQLLVQLPSHPLKETVESLLNPLELDQDLVLHQLKEVLAQLVLELEPPLLLDQAAMPSYLEVPQLLLLQVPTVNLL
jgi:hypothetical protein